MVRAQEKTVLVVDDEPDVREYLTQILRDAGFQVQTAGDGAEALDMIRRAPPDFISLDLVMPRKSGHKLLYELRKDRELSRIPVLIVTAHARDELGKGDLKDIVDNRVISGPGVYLEKPVKPLNYIRCVQRALGIEETQEDEDRISLQEELQRHLPEAEPHALRRALEALKRKNPEEG
ncbi:MAG: response regulator [Gemmatimonadetes bacterium]|jgi:CheY-like chemotaxis protein|nr:response regulator [Gemmatimonadota bacterium]